MFFFLTPISPGGAPRAELEGRARAAAPNGLAPAAGAPDRRGRYCHYVLAAGPGEARQERDPIGANLAVAVFVDQAVAPGRHAHQDENQQLGAA
jgi:hypothetical protein